MLGAVSSDSDGGNAWDSSTAAADKAQVDKMVREALTSNPEK